MNEDKKITFGERLKGFRARYQVTQRELIERVTTHKDYEMLRKKKEIHSYNTKNIISNIERYNLKLYKKEKEFLISVLTEIADCKEGKQMEIQTNKIPTSEVIADLAKNPHRTYVCEEDGTSKTLSLSVDGKLKFFRYGASGLKMSKQSPKGTMEGNISPSDKWRLLDVRVSFESAIEAIKSGRVVRCELPNSKTLLVGMDSLVYVEEIINGVFFVEQ